METPERDPGVSDPFKVATGVCWDAAKRFGGTCRCDTSGNGESAAQVAVKCSGDNNTTATMDEEVKDGFIVLQILCDHYVKEVSSSAGDADDGERRRLESVMCIHENFEANVEGGQHEYSSCEISMNGEKCSNCQKNTAACHQNSTSQDRTAGFIMTCGNVEPLYGQEILCFEGLEADITVLELPLDVTLNETASGESAYNDTELGDQALNNTETQPVSNNTETGKPDQNPDQTSDIAVATGPDSDEGPASDGESFFLSDLRILAMISAAFFVFLALITIVLCRRYRKFPRQRSNNTPAQKDKNKSTTSEEQHQYENVTSGEDTEDRWTDDYEGERQAGESFDSASDSDQSSGSQSDNYRDRDKVVDEHASLDYSIDSSEFSGREPKSGQDQQVKLPSDSLESWSDDLEELKS